jgi:hypothetical protein
MKKIGLFQKNDYLGQPITSKRRLTGTWLFTAVAALFPFGVVVGAASTGSLACSCCVDDVTAELEDVLDEDEEELDEDDTTLGPVGTIGPLVDDV